LAASILTNIMAYKKVLESFAQPNLPFIDWSTSSSKNIDIHNETIDYYRYFDATPQTLYLFERIIDTIQNIIPEEVSYLNKFDAFKNWLDHHFQFPNKTVELLVYFLKQDNGILSKRAKEKEFTALSTSEINDIEQEYQHIFGK
jgi:hypothetical protein